MMIDSGPKYSEKTCLSAILFTTNPTWPDRARTRAIAVGSQRLTAWAAARPGVFLTLIFLGSKSYPSLSKLFILLFLLGILDISMFIVCSPSKNCHFARHTSAVDVVSRDADVYKTKKVSFIILYNSPSLITEVLIVFILNVHYVYVYVFFFSQHNCWHNCTNGNVVVL
jgi:hypothetical protein